MLRAPGDLDIVLCARSCVVAWSRGDAGVRRGAPACGGAAGSGKIFHGNFARCRTGERMRFGRGRPGWWGSTGRGRAAEAAPDGHGPSGSGAAGPLIKTLRAPPAGPGASLRKTSTPDRARVRGRLGCRPSTSRTEEAAALRT